MLPSNPYRVAQASQRTTKKPSVYKTLPGHQRGAVLAVSLVLLIVMTILGVSNMRTSSMELRMATNNQARQQAFQGAEMALKIAEEEIEATGLDFSMLQACAPGSASCYDSTCEGGLCFNGTYDVVHKRSGCKALPRNPPVWLDKTLKVWDLANKHIVKPLPGTTATAKYVVEFLCFTPLDGEKAVNDNSSPGLFRVTALAESKDKRGQVMLQTTYRAFKK